VDASASHDGGDEPVNITCWHQPADVRPEREAHCNLAEPFIDADDIADVAVAALTQDGHVGQLYEVTGPRLVTWADAVAEVAQAAGRNAHLSDGVQRALGRPPRDFTDYARDAAATGIWDR
jgi:uncharacterized protein YbjT (DUF2867 family)